VAAVDGVDDGKQKTGYPWPNQTERADAQRAAGLEAEDSFLDLEPCP
jgi:hypothetical protein